MDAGEPRPTALPVTGPFSVGLALAPDGRRIAWTALSSSSGIWSAPVQTNGSAPAAPDAVPVVPAGEVGTRAGSPAVSPDGRIAFVGNRGNAGNNIYLVEPGHPPRQLTTDGRDHFVPFWIQGDDALAVFSNHGDGPGWWRLDPATGRETLLFHASELSAPAGVQSAVMGVAMGTAISTNLQRLAVAYVRDGVPNLWTGGPGTRTAGRVRWPSGRSRRSTAPSPRGRPTARWLAYQCSRGAGTQICVVDADGARARTAARARSRAHTSSANGRTRDWLLFAAKRQRGVERR